MDRTAEKNKASLPAVPRAPFRFPYDLTEGLDLPPQWRRILVEVLIKHNAQIWIAEDNRSGHSSNWSVLLYQFCSGVRLRAAKGKG